MYPTPTGLRKGGACQSKWTKGSMRMQREFQQKLSTLPKAGDVTWPEKCKQTSADSSISPVPFVLSIYKKMKYIKTFFEHEILR